MQDTHGQIVRRRSMCPSISGPETSLKKASAHAALTERLFLRWDHPDVLRKGVAPRPSLHLPRATPDGAGPRRRLQQLSLDGVTLLVEGSASNLDRVNSTPPSRTAHPSGEDPTATGLSPVVAV